MKNVTLRQRLSYAFDQSLSRGPAVIIAWLGLISAAFILVMSLLVWLAGLAPPAEDGAKPGLVGIAWFALMRTLDAGTMGGDAGSWPFLLTMLVVTFGGIFVISATIGAITNMIDEKLTELRKGRSRVLEEDHTVILGWSPQVFSIIPEIVTANANRRGASIVVLGERDKVEMEDELRARVGSTGSTRVICRTGNPTDLADLELANVQAARSIIVLPREDESPDAAVIKTLLAITNSPHRRPEPYHIVAPIADPKNLDVARLVGRHEAELIEVGDLLSRITVQTCRQSGLSVVYLELLDFGGDEIYFHEEPGLVGKTFGEALLAYESSALIGLRPRDGAPLLNPPMDRRIEAGDKVIAISEDDDTVRLSATPATIDESAIGLRAPSPSEPERTLILGWNDRLTTIVNELDQYVPAGSTVTVVADQPDVGAMLREGCPNPKNQTIRFERGDTTDRRTLDALELAEIQHVILLSEPGLSAQEADSRTLITLLHLRDISDKMDRDFSIVSEMLDVRNRTLADVTRADDFIVGDRLVSLMLAQVAENKELNAVFTDLFDPEGSEIYLKPAGDYVTPGRPVSFYTVTEAARRRGEVAIGYRLKAESGDAAKAYGVRVNPNKSERVTFSDGDRIAVLAES